MTEKKLSLKQKRALAIVLTEPKHGEAYRKIGISESTFYRWLKNPAFIEAIEAEREKATQEALSLLKYNLRQAVETLAGLLNASEDHIKRQAAADLIRSGLRVFELGEITARLDRIEKIIAEKTGDF